MDPRSNARDWQARVRLWSALVLCVFELLEILVYGAGLISGEAMKQVLRWEAPLLLLFPLFSVALYTHMGLALWKFYQRNTLVMAPWEALQLALGLVIPLLMVTPSLALAAMDFKFGTSGTPIETLMVTYPEFAWRSAAMALVIIAHAQIGVHSILRVKRWYPAAQVVLFTILLVLPAAAIAGRFFTDSIQVFAPQHLLTPEQLDFVRLIDWQASAALVGLYGLLFLARELRVNNRRRQLTVLLTYSDGRQIQAAPATTVLEASRSGGVAHASICGGRGRCTTCRVKVVSGMENLSPVGEREHRALARIGAPHDIRLACQAQMVGGEIEVALLLPPNLRPRSARGESKNTIGRDVELAVMFVDLRGFTSLSERKFPYDVVYILNSYFQAMGTEIEAHGGTVDKYLGDGILAYFGLDHDGREACLNALQASRAMALGLQALNQRLQHVVPEGLSMGIGIHFGDLILGEIGSSSRRQLTIIGDTVNTASRLEALNKGAGTQLVLSSIVAAKAGVDLTQLPVQSIQLRGKGESLRVYALTDILGQLSV
jgi:adenylate cyclase